MYGYRMLARSRRKYGKPNYPGRIKSSKSNFDITEQDIADLTEPDDRMQELWKLIKENVRDNISQVSFETWIEPCCPVSITDNRIVLNDDAKLADFRKVFGDKMEDLTVYGCVSSEANEMYQEVSRAFPVCNHIHSIKDNNLGYTQGIMQSGIPFEAELWRNETSRNLSVVIPEIYKSVDSSGHTLNNENVLGFHTQVKRLHDGVLTTGMEDRGEVSDLDVTIWYVNFLQEHGIVVFTDKMENGSVSLTTDIEGNNLAYITVTLEEGGRTYATTDLKFMSFPYQPKKTTDRVLRVVK